MDLPVVPILLVLLLWLLLWFLWLLWLLWLREHLFMTRLLSGHLIMVQQGSMCQHGGVHNGRMGDDLGRGLVDDGIEAIVVIGGVVDGAHRAIGLDQRVLAWEGEVDG